MSVRKRGERYQVRVRLGSGQRIERTLPPGASRADARALEDAIRRRHIDTSTGRRPDRLIEEALQQWEPQARALKSWDRDLKYRVAVLRRVGRAGSTVDGMAPDAGRPGLDEGNEMTDAEINQLRDLLAKATPGPWAAVPREDPCYYVARVGQTDVIPPYGVELLDEIADAALIVAAVNALPSLLDEIERLKRACSMMNDEVSQTLGRALRYPRFCDDQKNFPGSTDADGVCVGDHVAESLAAEAAKEIERLRADAARYRWLRDSGDYMMPPTPDVIRLDIDDNIEHLSGDALDAAVDAAMKEQQQ